MTDQTELDAPDQQLPADAEEDGLAPRRPLGGMILRNTAALPALVTLLNGIAGFASIYYATKDGLGGTTVPSPNLTLAAWLVFAALAFDALDGRLARMTRKVTDFGAQLDSLCDVVSFGVAPAILMVRAVAVTRQIEEFDIFTPQAPVLGKVVVAIAAIYVCCAILRLARFNIENAPDLLRHLHFKGLPAPGAAAAVAALVLLFGHLQQFEEGLKSAQWLNVTVGLALPAVTLATALLMISRLRYPHLINRFIVGKRSFGYIVWAAVLIVLAWVFLQMAVALVALVFAASGPADALIRKFRRRGRRIPR